MTPEVGPRLTRHLGDTSAGAVPAALPAIDPWLQGSTAKPKRKQDGLGLRPKRPSRTGFEDVPGSLLNCANPIQLEALLALDGVKSSRDHRPCALTTPELPSFPRIKKRLLSRPQS